MSFSQVDCTSATLDLIEHLQRLHGPNLIFYQSAGCCDGSAPMCSLSSDFRLNENDIKLGEIGGCPFYMAGQHYEYWKHSFLIIDVVPGRSSNFSLEQPEGLCFITRSRLLTEEEENRLQSTQ